MESVMDKTQLAEKRYKGKLIKDNKEIRKQNESNKETKQNERKQKRENIVFEDVDLAGFSI